MAIKTTPSKKAPKTHEVDNFSTQSQFAQTFDFFGSPESSTVKAAFYWPKDGVSGSMDIIFKDLDGSSRSVYTYESIPLEVWHQFKSAPSKGSFMQVIRKYNGVKL